MKVLHTSDWHLGQSFFTKSRKNEHEQFFKWLLEVVEQESIDAVVVVIFLIPALHRVTRGSFIIN
jgi:exonuclease SbcD